MQTEFSLPTKPILRLAQRSSLQKCLGILRITPKDIAAMADFFQSMAQQEDSVGRVREDVTDERNLRRIKKRIPLGVVAMIAEARPSVLTDSAALCMRTGNALVYLGSRHSARTDGAVAEVLQETVASVGLPAALITISPAITGCLLR